MQLKNRNATPEFRKKALLLQRIFTLRITKTGVQRNPLVSKKNRPTPIYHIKDKEVYITLQYKKTTYNKQRLQLGI